MKVFVGLVLMITWLCCEFRCSKKNTNYLMLQEFLNLMFRRVKMHSRRTKVKVSSSEYLNIFL